MQKTTEIFLKPIVEMALFFALSDDETVDPDEAVNQLEQLANTLSKLDKHTKKSFADFTKALAKQEEQTHNHERANALQHLSEQLGLVS